MTNPSIEGSRRAARRLLEEYCITDPSEIKLNEIAYLRGVLVREEDMSGMEGMLLRKGNRGIIRAKRNLTYPGRTRFAIGHELGHWECHMNVSQAWICNSRDIHAYAGSNVEIEANAFSSELLMPTALVKPRLNIGINIQAIRDVADAFSTSLTATAVRAIELTDECAYLVFSHSGIVRWWQKSRTADRFFERAFRIRPNSRAWLCETSPEVSTGMEIVETHAWFDFAEGEDHAVEVWEESVYFHDLDTVMTILSMG